VTFDFDFVVTACKGMLAWLMCSLHALQLPTMQPAVAGFGGDVYQECVIQDPLHQDHKGMGKHITDRMPDIIVLFMGTSKAEANAMWQIVNTQLSNMRHHYALRIPIKAFFAEKLTAEEHKGMWRCLAVCMNGIVSEELVAMLAAYAAMQLLRDAPIHTEVSIGCLWELCGW
jgi:hypothetical protein